MPGTEVLRNLAGLEDQALLTEFETASLTQRAEEPLPSGLLSITHYRAIHRHLFQDVYRWAGTFRTVRIGKGGAQFCYPENIDASLKALFGELRNLRYLRGLEAAEFAERAAWLLSELNAIHPFREGNGRTQNAFLALLASRAGHPLDFDRLEPARFLRAMILSFSGDRDALIAEIRLLVGLED